MTLGKRPRTQPRRSQYGYGGRSTNSGPPAWLVFLMGIALVFGVYYLWSGFQEYLSTGGLGAAEATNRAMTVIPPTQEAADAEAPSFSESGFTAVPSATEIPPCMDFAVSVPSAIVRAQPSTNSAILDSLSQGETVCVRGQEANGDWYVIDRNPNTRRLETAYMSSDIIEAVNPTPTPTQTLTPAPSVTDAPTLTPSRTPTPRPTATPDFSVTDTPPPTPTPSATPPVQSA
jgi:hypothetical protein